MSFEAWRRLVERASDIDNVTHRLQIWVDEIANADDTSLDDRLSAFSPPETTGVVARGEDPAMRVYALGVLGYALLSGSIPWDKASEDELRHRIVADRLPELSDASWPPAFQGRINRVIATATAKDPASRFPHPQVLKVEVANALAGVHREREQAAYTPRIHRDAYQHIDQWLGRARSRAGPVLMLVGASGIGKTYLWETIHDTRARNGERWFYVKASQNGRRPYEAISLLLESVRSETQEILDDDSIPPPARAFVRAIAPHLGPSDTRDDPSEVREPARELARIIRRIGHSSPFRLFCFDDLQWIDTYSRRVIEELSRGPESVSVVTLTREEIPIDVPRETVYLNPLNRTEARDFARSLKVVTDGLATEAFEQACAVSAGNPMALRLMLREGTPGVTADSKEVLLTLASARLSTVSHLCQSVLSVVALVGAPLSPSLISRETHYTVEEIETALQEAEDAFLVDRRDSKTFVWFVHDSIETAARAQARGDPDACVRATRILVEDARSGNGRAASAAIGLLGAIRPGEIPRSDLDSVLIAAARQSVATLAPEEALQIVRDWGDGSTPTARVELHLIAHEAAYLLGNRDEMSRYYRAIVASGDTERAAEARYLWIRRCYADARFSGAVAVGVRSLSRPDGIIKAFRWSSDGSEALEFFRRHTPRKLLSMILRRGCTNDRTVRRTTDSLAYMLLPVLTTDRPHLLHIAYYTLRIGIERGATPLTALGFIAWALHQGTRRTPGRWVEEYMACAKELSGRSGDRITDHTVRVLCAAFGGPWTGSFRAFSDRLERLQSEGRELGNREFTGHALHIQRQALLYRGEPIAMVRDLLRESRLEIQSYGLIRTDNALSKHHAVAEALMGMTNDPGSIDGDIISEDDYFQRIVASDDQISLSGFRTVKAFLALYADRPQDVFEQLTRLEEVISSISLFHEHLLIRFYLAIVAYRLNRRGVGNRMLRIVRRWERENPATNGHRLLFIRAERAALRGQRLVARKLLDRAIPLALRERFFNEAALMAERAGDISGSKHYWMAAESAYRHWGAVHAVERVRRKLGRADAPRPAAHGVRPEARLHEDLFHAHSIDKLARRLAEHLLQTTYASQVLVALRSEALTRRRLYRWSPGGVVTVGEPSADLSLMVTETREGECRLLTSEDEFRGRNYGVVGRSDRVHDSDVAALIIGADGSAAYTQSIVENVRGALQAGALHAALLSARIRIEKDERDLREKQRQLSENERYRRQLFATVTDAFLLVDTVGNVRFSNSAAEPFLDYASTAPPTLKDDLRTVFFELIEPSGHAPKGPLQYTTSDQRHVQIKVAPAGSENEELLALSISDITDAIRRETQLARQERQLVVADRLASIGMFSASIVHEISNPNHILQLNTQSLLVVLSWLRGELEDESNAAAVAQLHELVEQIQEAARRVESVLQMVKSYSREGLQERWELLDPAQVCSRAFRFSKIMASQYTASFRLVVAENLPQIWGEAALLEQALVNLIKNACEALSDRDGRVELHAYTEAHETGVVFAVCDTGRGFPDNLRDTAGTPFASDRHDSGGTGLGLSIVSGIVEKHTGDLHIAGDENFTTRVEIHIPTQRNRSDRTSVSIGSQRPAGTDR
ncbi:MAG: ATP-binding protein [Spirochaetaceae bacterium]